MTSLLDPPTIRDFAGEVIAPDDPGFDEARRVHNAAVDRRPALVARCTGALDVVAALRHARRSGLPVTVRGGGHASAGFAVADDALAIDLSRMDAVQIDPTQRRARVQGGATWRVLDAATQEHGLAVTGARMPSVGVAGFTLGSGSGWLERRLGLAADVVRSARVVTAAGEVVTASAYEHPDLFWALRGGGPSFGIVVELEFALARVGPVVQAGLMAWPSERAAEVGAAYVELMAGAPDDLGGGLALLAAPAAPYVPTRLHGTELVAVVALWTGERHEGEELLRPLRALAPSIDAVRPRPYTGLQGMFDRPAVLRVPARERVEGGFLDGLPPAAIAAVADAAADRPSALGSILLQPLGGAFGRMPEVATPLGRRGAAWHWQAGSAWFESAGDAPNRAWTQRARSALAPWSAGETYPNFIADPDPERLRAAYAPVVWEHLRAARAEWDPDGVFAGGHAIPRPGRRTLAR